jgi:hypothetical protein
MAVTIESTTQVGGAIEVIWSSDLPTPTFYIYVNGELAAQTDQTRYTIPASPDEQVFIEIFDDPDAEPTPVYEGRAELCWYRVEGAESYRVDERVGGAWVEQGMVVSLDWFNAWRTRYLEDSQMHHFRIVPVVQGNDMEAVSAFHFIVRYPDVPAQNFAYNGSVLRTVTIS